MKPVAIRVELKFTGTSRAPDFAPITDSTACDSSEVRSQTCAFRISIFNFIVPNLDLKYGAGHELLSVKRYHKGNS